MEFWIRTKSLGVCDRAVPPSRHWLKSPDLLRVIDIRAHNEVVDKLREVQRELLATKAALHLVTEPPLLTNDRSTITIK